MKRHNGLWIGISLGVLAAAPALAGSGPMPLRPERELRPELIPVPVRSNAGVEVWTDVGEGSAVRPGEVVDVYVRTDRSAYIAVVDIDTRGRARLLYPVAPGDDGFVRGGRLVAIPGPYADYRLAVAGPSGTERIVALASDRPLVHRWRDALETSADLSVRDDRFYGDYDARGGNAYPASGSPRVELLEPQLVPVPVRRGNVDRADTWFEVVSRARYRARRY